jgi:carboxypeptidase family protein
MISALHLLLVVQATQATIVGTVRDERTGGPLAGAIVALTELDRAAVAAEDGRYALREVPAGPRHLTVRFIGYAPRALHALVPRDGQLEINVSLRPEPVRLQALEVRAPSAGRGSAGADALTFPDRGTSIAAVWDHPLLSEPDVFQALEGGDVVLRPESPSGIHVRGGAADQTAYLLDGIPVFSPFHAAGLFSAWNPDAVAWVDLSAAAPSPTDPSTLSGTVTATTRTPGDQLRVQGGGSNTQGRLTLDGPLGLAGAAFLVSLRSGFPAAFAPNEASYLRGESGDRLAKLEAPVLGGRLLVLGYDSENEVSTAAAVARNAFDWSSQSAGAEWRGVLAGLGVRARAWTAGGQATAAWDAAVSGLRLGSTRRDDGFLASVEQRAAHASTALGLRVENSWTAYRIASDSATGTYWAMSGRTRVATIFAQHTRDIGRGLDLKLGTSLAAAGRALYLDPRTQLRWHPSEQWTVSGSYARLHQFTQSLRNEESVVGNVFPVDLYVGAGMPGIPVARGDHGVLAVDYRPAAGVHVGAQAYTRAARGILLVAPRSGEPFATAPGGVAVGSSASRGLTLDAAVATARYGLMASYGLQHLRLTYGGGSADSGYVPDYGARHLLQGGVIVFPSTTSSIRLGVTGILGRRSTTIAGGLEWEACNLLDLGCEFSGSPHYGGEPLGATALPAYVRVDLGFRKHWHFAIGKRDAMIALFGTVTNVLNRINVLTYERNPTTGQVTPIEMRPLAPLVVGIDWRF